MFELRYSLLQNFLKKYVWLILGIFSFLLGIVSSGVGISFYVLEKEERKNSSDAVQITQEEKIFDENEIKKINEHVIVFVAGAVKKPGLCELQNGLRLADAVSAAGGLTKEASIRHLAKHMNMASQIEDGSSFYIPREDEVEQELLMTQYEEKNEETKKIGEGSGLDVNVNTATAKQLDDLEGIGAARAEQIITNRPYIDFSDFLQRSGLSEAVAEQIREQIRF